MSKAKEIVKEFIYASKLYRGMSRDEALRTSLAGYGLPPISRKERAEIFEEFQADSELDEIRIYNHLYYGKSAGYNPDSNIWVKNRTTESKTLKT